MRLYAVTLEICYQYEVVYLCQKVDEGIFINSKTISYCLRPSYTPPDTQARSWYSFQLCHTITKVWYTLTYHISSERQNEPSHLYRTTSKQTKIDENPTRYLCTSKVVLLCTNQNTPLLLRNLTAHLENKITPIIYCRHQVEAYVRLPFTTRFFATPSITVQLYSQTLEPWAQFQLFAADLLYMFLLGGCRRLMLAVFPLAKCLFAGCFLILVHVCPSRRSICDPTLLTTS